MLNWISDTSFEIDGVKFALDYVHGGTTRRSTDNDFTLVKDKAFLPHYTGLAGERFDRVLELGLYQGGSLAFLDKLLRPKHISGIELSTVPIPALDAYAADRQGRMRVHYGTSQDDLARLNQIVEEDFGGTLDLVVDDASHFYEPTRASFVELFPKLRPGGLYIIEDWSWSFQSEFQAPDAPWSGQNSPAGLILDLMEDMTIKPAIAEITVVPQMIKIRRSEWETAHRPFSVENRRGRTFGRL